MSKPVRLGLANSTAGYALGFRRPHNGSAHNRRGSPARLDREDQILRQMRKAALSPPGQGRESARRRSLEAPPTPRPVQGRVIRRSSATYEQKRRIGRWSHSERPASRSLQEAEAERSEGRSRARSEARQLSVGKAQPIQEPRRPSFSLDGSSTYTPQTQSPS